MCGGLSFGFVMGASECHVQGNLIHPIDQSKEVLETFT